MWTLITYKTDEREKYEFSEIENTSVYENAPVAQ